MSFKPLVEKLDKIMEAKLSMIAESYAEVAPQKIVDEICKDALYGLLFKNISVFYAQSVLGGRITTSLHRNFGDIIEVSVREIFKHAYSLDDGLARSSFSIQSIEKRSTRTTDVSIPFEALTNAQEKSLRAYHVKLCGKHTPALLAQHGACRGLGYEVRQCYKSNDSKRRTADIDMSDLLFQNKIIPMMLIFCSSSSPSIIRDYRRLSKWMIVEGDDAFDYVREISGFDFRGYLDTKISQVSPRLVSLFKV